MAWDMAELSILLPGIAPRRRNDGQIRSDASRSGGRANVNRSPGQDRPAQFSSSKSQSSAIGCGWP